MSARSSLFLERSTRLLGRFGEEKPRAPLNKHRTRPRGDSEGKLTVDAEAVDVELADEGLDPVRVRGDDGRVLGVDIGERDVQVSEPAVLLAGRVAPVNGAVRVVLRLYLAWSDEIRNKMEGVESC